MNFSLIQKKLSKQQKQVTGRQEVCRPVFSGKELFGHRNLLTKVKTF